MSDWKPTAIFTDGQEAPSAARDWERPIRMQRPCPCGCDQRDGDRGVGYLNGGRNGAFVSVWAPDEDAYQAMLKVFGGEA